MTTTPDPDLPDMEPDDSGDTAAPMPLGKLDFIVMEYGWLKSLHDQMEEALRELELLVPEELRAGAVERARVRAEAMHPHSQPMPARVTGGTEEHGFIQVEEDKPGQGYLP